MMFLKAEVTAQMQQITENTKTALKKGMSFCVHLQTDSTVWLSDCFFFVFLIKGLFVNRTIHCM